LKLAVWSPLPPSPSGIADYVAEQLPLLAAAVDVRVVVEDPSAVDAALRARFPVVPPEQGGESDLDLYHLGNSPAHAYVYRAALARPGVAVLHEWTLHHLVLHETVERGDVWGYLREMRRAHGERGSFAGRQIARALGGELLPALFPLSDRLLEASLAVVGLTEHVTRRARARLPGRPVLHLPHHATLPLPGETLPSPAEARARLGLPAEALILTAPGLATAAKRIDVALRALARLRPRYPRLLLVVAGSVDPALPLVEAARAAGVEDALRVTGRLDLEHFALHLCAADAVLALRFPTHGEISGALVRALLAGRPALVTAGTPAAEEFPEGVVVPVTPGPAEEEELVALLDHLLGAPALRGRIGALARAHVRRGHDLAALNARLVAFLREVAGRREPLRAAVEAARADGGGLLGFFTEEVRAGARDLGLFGLELGLRPLLEPLARGTR
jgi:glycosyltransferase involved in cell wall biosynthesis